MEAAPSRSTRVLRWSEMKGQEITSVVIAWAFPVTFVGLMLDAFEVIPFNLDRTAWVAMFGGSAVLEWRRPRR